MERTPDIQKLAIELVRLQAALVSAWRDRFGDTVILEADLRLGAICSDQDDWAYRQHGAGVEFKRASDGLVVDIHDRFHEPLLFDQWRFELFLESKAILMRGAALEAALSACPAIEQQGRHFSLRP